MAEYIEREALMEDFRIFMAENCDKEKCVSAESCKACEAKCLWYRITIKAPAADVAPVRHARWIKTVQENGCAEWTEFKCCVCGAVFDGNEWLFDEWKGCPVCLARMDLEVSE